MLMETGPLGKTSERPLKGSEPGVVLQVDPFMSRKNCVKLMCCGRDTRGHMTTSLTRENGTLRLNGGRRIFLRVSKEKTTIDRKQV